MKLFSLNRHQSRISGTFFQLVPRRKSRVVDCGGYITRRGGATHFCTAFRRTASQLSARLAVSRSTAFREPWSSSRSFRTAMVRNISQLTSERPSKWHHWLVSWTGNPPRLFTSYFFRACPGVEQLLWVFALLALTPRVRSSLTDRPLASSRGGKHFQSATPPDYDLPATKFALN